MDMLRQVENFSDRFGVVTFPEELVAVLEELVAFKGKAYGEIALVQTTSFTSPS
jgi:hypothetical protein